jgi:hypothetical protein
VERSQNEVCLRYWIAHALLFFGVQMPRLVRKATLGTIVMTLESGRDPVGREAFVSRMPRGLAACASDPHPERVPVLM